MIRIHDLSRAFGKIQALQGVSLDLRDGEIVAVVGANAAGKTTFLRTLVGALLPDSGRIEYDSRPFDREDLSIRRNIFFVPDTPYLYPDWTVIGHLAMILRLYERERPGAENLAVQLLRDFDLLAWVEMPHVALSRGQQFKASLCGALISEAKHLLFDEPFGSGIDPSGIIALKRHLEARAKGGATVVYSTQLLDVAEDFATRICILHEGKVEAFGTIEELRGRVSTESGRLEEIFRKLREKTA